MATQQINALVKLISDLQARGTKVVLVMMPEHSYLRGRLPAIAMEHLQESLASDLGANDPPLVDCRDALPDDDFADISHVNTDGRSDFSKLLAGKILQYLPADHPPLMAAGGATISSIVQGAATGVATNSIPATDVSATTAPAANVPPTTAAASRP